MKLKIPVSYYAITALTLSQITVDNEALNNINHAAFTELRKLLLKVAVNNVENRQKVITKSIPDSYGLLFFETFNGIQMQGYENVVIKEVCKQVEKQLYRSGKYQFNNKNQTTIVL